MFNHFQIEPGKSAMVRSQESVAYSASRGDVDLFLQVVVVVVVVVVAVVAVAVAVVVVVVVVVVLVVVLVVAAVVWAQDHLGATPSNALEI